MILVTKKFSFSVFLDITSVTEAYNLGYRFRISLDENSERCGQ